MTNDQIITEINAYMQKFTGRANSDWYVGIAAAPRDRLFIDHCVDEKNGVWIFRQAASDSCAREVESAYHAAGFDGGPGGGDRTTVFVYAYLKTRSTEDT